ncbi:DUF1820 family protein [Candidatus Macondimonas diazotrophica]|jgi:hypothetical protein|uniref:DUF1820 family protein n=1 Tax=Candidatus Macondimonas diazotrophica TaxID=2305248 RepID=A0A4Z0FBC1_9GAMM|nr:DUF1820 family protein [Candidatus Macondimonas diazotrophica]MDY6956960.1 DUF1820 family protein [Pseudomonadota bacterium]NCT99989.1 DUF1820 family protein [Candidatus Macondimonas diazotrophica]TFZ83785.1 DUF1820 family protein [Candidatus Macondimonas diazotrophica]HBG51003.1 DUF1820 domain-containing protein [Gammaproteobacteria bacterium]
MANKLFRVSFLNQGKVYEVYARTVTQDALYGFVTLENLIFGTRSDVLVDPSEERLKSEFAGVERSHVPLHALIRIDEVEREGVARITPLDGNVTPFPGPFYNNPGNGPGTR